jgi:hypothetical protein
MSRTTALQAATPAYVEKRARIRRAIVLLDSHNLYVNVFGQQSAADDLLVEATTLLEQVPA